MRGRSFILFLTLFSVAEISFAQLEEVEFNTQIAGHPVDIQEVESVEVVEEVVDQDNVLDSYLLVEVTGTYESHGEGERVGAQFLRTDDGVPVFGPSHYEVKLYSITPVDGAFGLGGGFITALSNPKKFKLRFKIKPNLWEGKPGHMAEWLVRFKYNKYQPVSHTVSRGISAILRDFNGDLRWTFHKIGFPHN